MAKPTTADEILPLVDALSPQEHVRLLRLITARPTANAAAVYKTLPPGNDEFSATEDPLAWESDGWEVFD